MRNQQKTTPPAPDLAQKNKFDCFSNAAGETPEQIIANFTASEHPDEYSERLYQHLMYYMDHPDVKDFMDHGDLSHELMYVRHAEKLIRACYAIYYRKQAELIKEN